MAGPVQSVSFTGSSSPVTVTISATGTGNCLVVFFGAADTVTAPTVSGITLGGAAGNFAQAAGAGGGTHIDAEIWTDRNAASGQTSVVISWSGGFSTTVAGRVEEWAGIVTGVSPVDVWCDRHAHAGRRNRRRPGRQHQRCVNVDHGPVVPVDESGRSGLGHGCR